MMLETFFKKFDLFADTPGAVAKMRELVLDLAATGRLLPPESEWETRPLKQLTSKIGSGSTPAGGRESYFSEGVPLIRSMNVHFRGFDHTGLVFLSDEQAAKLSNVIVQARDVLLNITGASIGRVTIAPSEMAGARVNQHVTIIRPTSELSSTFLTIFLASPSVQQMIDDIQVGATRQALTKAMIAQFDIPLPPLAEQKRIVAKVDELMALCDRLEAQQQERETRHAALARASLNRFADAPTPANLGFLFHPSYTISPADLRKSILTLAVQGKLVPQNPNDEPASILLRKISDEKQALIAEKMLKKSQTPENSIDNTVGMRLPESWKWAKANDLFFTTKLAGFEYTDHMHLTDDGEIPVIRAQNVKPDGVLKTKLKFIDRQTSEALPRSALTKPTLLVTFIGAGIGDVALFDEPNRWHLAPNVAKMEPFNERGEKLSIRFLLFFMQSPFGRSEIFKHLKSTAQPSISMATIRDIDVPVPPLAEQHRIVTKVDQLMALVDQLETQLETARATGAKLMNALVAELTALN